MILKISVLLCISIAEANDNSKYCKVCKDHTLCIYPTSKPGKACNEYLEKHLTEEEKNSILLLHNEARSKVALGQEKRGNPGPQPTAANMLELTWDEELATIAQRWADQCNTDDHDTCRDLSRFRVGQNMIAFGISVAEFESDLEELIKKWYDEVEDVPARLIRRYRRERRRRSNPIFHYTQMVWAKSYRIGCGRSVFVVEMGNFLSMNEFLVCNYGPSGNIYRKPVYEIGPPASKCPKGPSKDFKGLCRKAEGNNGKQKSAKGSIKSSRSNFTQRPSKGFKFSLSQDMSTGIQARISDSDLLEKTNEEILERTNKLDFGKHSTEKQEEEEEQYKYDDDMYSELEDETEIKYFKIERETWIDH